MAFYYRKDIVDNCIKLSRRCSECDADVRSYYLVCPNCGVDTTKSIDPINKYVKDINE